MHLLHGSIAHACYCADAACAPSSSQRKTPNGNDDLTGIRNRKRNEAIMAYVNNTRAASFGLMDRLNALVASFKANRAQRAIYARTVYELNQLTDRELSDLGIARISITDVARVAAYGK
jgi:uncharacterized protein YjiS (DUF1127 family)